MKNRKVKSKRGGTSLFGVAARFHWLVNVLLAVIFYFAIIYAQSYIVITRPAHQLMYMVAEYAKYPVALFFLLAAIPAALRRRKRRQLLNKVSKYSSIDKGLEKLSWHDFELMVGEIFRNNGYSVCEGQSASKDGGIDLTVRKRGKTYLVQCKHWKASVGVPVVREIFGVATMMGAQAIVVCSGKYTKEASAFAKKANVKLIGIEQLENAISR